MLPTRSFTFLCSLFLFQQTALAQTSPPANHQPVTLEPIVISASSTEHSLRHAPASISVITADDLKDRPVSNLADAMRDVPGVTITGIGLNRKGVSFRGMDSKYSLVLINGRRITPSINAIAHSNIDLNWVPTSQIERIEVIRGPMSSLYGSEALGGTINIITKTVQDSWSGEVSSYFSNGIDDLAGNSYIFSASASGPLIKNKLFINVHGEKKYQGEVAMPSAANGVRPSYLEGLRSHQAGVGLKWIMAPGHELTLDHLSGQEDNTRHAIATKTIRQPGLPPVTTQYSYETSDDIRRRQTSLGYQGEWSWGKMQANLYDSGLERTNTRNDTSYKDIQKLTETIADLRVNIPLAQRHLLSAGAEWRKEKLEDDGFTGSGKTSLIHTALYLQDEIAFTPDWSVIIGDRLDHHEKFGTHHSPRLYTVYDLSEEFTLKGGIGKGFKAPTLKQLSPTYSGSGRGGFFTVHGNPNLSPETSTNLELSAIYETDRLFLEGTIYRNKLKNKISYACTANCGQRGLETGTYQNIDRARYTGAELGASYALTNSLKLKLSYNYLNARDNEDRHLTLTPRHSGSAGLTWTPSDNLTLGARMQYIGTQYMDSLNHANKQKASQVYSLHAGYQLNKHLRISAGIENLTNERFIDEDTVNTYAEAGRRLNLGLTLSF